MDTSAISVDLSYLMATLLPIIVGSIITAIIQYTKKFGWSSRGTLAALSLIAGTLYAGFKLLVPMDWQIGIIQFLIMSAGAAMLVHQYLVRPAQDAAKKGSDD